MKLQRILVPTDFSDASLQALDPAVALARRFGGRLLVVHGIEPIHFAAGGEIYAPSVDLSALLREQRRSAEQRLGKLTRDLAKRRIDAQAVLASGPAHQVIVDTARKRSADLIVMSTHGRSGFSHLFLGSVAEKVVRAATCAVLTVRSGATRARARRKRR